MPNLLDPCRIRINQRIHRSKILLRHCTQWFPRVCRARFFSFMPSLFLLTLMFGLPACATFIHGEEQRVWITTDPYDSMVRIDDSQRISPPNFISLPRRGKHVITAEKEGCSKEQIQMGRKFNYISTLLGNLGYLFLSPIAILVDLASGGAWTLEPDHVHLTLSCPPS